VQGSKRDSYRDQGASCYDQRDGDISYKVRVSGTSPLLDKLGWYRVRYDCINSYGTASVPTYRNVSVVDTICPQCSMDNSSLTIEASFPFDDPGVTCVDTFDGELVDHIQTVGYLDTEKTGTYYLTYRAVDLSGNGNDGNCIGNQTVIRTVQVIDTLSPVIQLHYHSSFLGHRRLLARDHQTHSMVLPCFGLLFILAGWLIQAGKTAHQNPPRSSASTLV